jgi:hypothetical protein
MKCHSTLVPCVEQYKQSCTVLDQSKLDFSLQVFTKAG